MKHYDVDVEFAILVTILQKLKPRDYFNDCDKKCIAYITNRITELLDPDNHIQFDDASNAIPQDELYYPPDDELELFDSDELL